MSGLQNAEPSFSTRQELLDLQDDPPDGAPGVDSESHSPRSPQSVGAGGSAHSAVFTGATSFQGQVCERGAAQCGLSPMEQDSEQLCGWGALRPRALQVFNSPHWALVFLFQAAFLQGMIVYGFISASVSSIERRFDLSSSQIGLIVGSYDIASCICLPFVSYFGGNGHKPRWLGWGVGIMGLGSLLFALPHFSTPPYQVTVPERSDLCSSNSTHFSVNQDTDGLSQYFYVFVLGQLLHGVGATPLYTLGFTFLEENVKSNSAPLFMGVFYSAAILGPAVGILLGGYLLSFYTEVTVETELTPASPLWVGAWWIGFILGGILCFPMAFVILAFPKKLSGSQNTAASRHSEDQQNKDGRLSSTSNPQFVKLLKDMARSLLVLVTNPTFMFLCLAGATVHGLTVSLTTFMIKFFESQFGLTSSMAALIFGAMSIPTSTGGTLCGSYVIKRFKMLCGGIIRFCIACSVVNMFLNFILFIHCPTVSMAGVTTSHSSGRLDLRGFEEGRVLSAEQRLDRLVHKDQLVAPCNADCSCDRQRFSPVCGADDLMYYSPCYAGCTNLTDTGEVFTGCSCVRTNVSWGQEGLAEPGKCATSCPHTAVFMTLFAISIFSNLLPTTPIFAATLRVVPPRLKSFALGIQWILVRTLGTIPGPIVLGSLLDQACLLKQSEGQSSCYLYENSQMSYFILLNCVVYRVLGAVLFILALVFLKAPPEPPPLSAESPQPQDNADG